MIQNTSKNLQKIKNNVKYKKQIKEMTYAKITDPNSPDVCNGLNRQLGIKIPRILDAD